MPLPAALTRKAGPLKVWQWGAIAGVGAVGLVLWKRAHPSSSNAATGAGTAAGPLSGGGSPFPGIPDVTGGGGGGGGGDTGSGGGTGGSGGTGGTGSVGIPTPLYTPVGGPGFAGITDFSSSAGGPLLSEPAGFTPTSGPAGFIPASSNPNSVASGLPPNTTNTIYTTAGGGGWITPAQAAAINVSPPSGLSQDAISQYLAQHPTPTTSASAVQSAPAVTATPITSPLRTGA